MSDRRGQEVGCSCAVKSRAAQNVRLAPVPARLSFSSPSSEFVGQCAAAVFTGVKATPWPRSGRVPGARVIAVMPRSFARCQCPVAAPCARQTSPEVAAPPRLKLCVFFRRSESDVIPAILEHHRGHAVREHGAGCARY